MEYTAEYTLLDGPIKAGGKAMIVFGYMGMPVDVFEDDEGFYFYKDGVAQRPQDFGSFPIVPVELSLCTEDINEGDYCFIRHVWEPARKVSKISGVSVYFESGADQVASKCEVYKRVATISEQVNFLSPGTVITSSMVSFVVVSNSMEDTRPFTPSTIIDEQNEKLVAMVTCPHCGTRK